MRTKRLCWFIVAVCLTLLLGGAVSAETVADGTCGDNLTWVLDDDGVLTIEGDGVYIGYEYYTDAPWYPYANEVKTVTMTDSIITIGKDTFRECSCLTEVQLSANVRKIGDNAFFGCTSLCDIELPESLEVIGNYTFCGCTGLPEVTLPARVYQIGEGVFYGCTRLESVTLPDALKVISNEAFRECKSLSSITFPHRLTTIWSNAFLNCHSLTQIVFPESLTTLGKSVFQGCNRLQSVYLNEGLEVLSEYTFTGCTSLTDVYFPDTLTTIGSNVFQSCYQLSSLHFPESLEHIGKYAFLYCTSLTSITLPENVTYLAWTAFAGSSVQEITFTNDAQISYQVLANTPELTVLHFSDAIQNIDPEIFKLHSICAYNVQDEDGEGYVSKNGVLYFYDPYLEAYTLVRYPVAKTEKTYCVLNGTETIGAYAFQNCTLTMIDLSNGVTSIEKGAFGNCVNLETLCVDRLECMIDDSAFTGTSIECLQCSNIDRYVEDSPYISLSTIKKYTVKDTNHVGYRDIDGVLFFYDASTEQLKLVHYPMGCKDTQYIVPEGTHTIVQNAFAGVDSLKNIALPTSLRRIEEGAFRVCTSLKSIHFPDNMTSLGAYAFYGCSALESVTLSKSLSTIGNYTFADCTALQSCTLPQNLKYIGMRAFYNCRYLKEISIPESIVSMDTECFANCTALRKVYFYGAVPGDLAQNAFRNNHATFTIHYIEGKVGWTSPTWNGYTTATFIPEGYSLTLSTASPYILQNTTITSVPTATTVSAFLSNFTNAESLTVTTADGTVLPDTAYVGTGCVVSTSTGDSLIIIVTGDLTGDGLSDADDLTLLQRYYSGYPVSIDHPLAADLNGDGNMTRADVMILSRRLAGWMDATTPPDSIIVIG